MNFQTFGNEKAPTLLLIPGLGVSYEIFVPLIRLTEDRFRIIAVEVGGFTLGKHTRFTSVDDQAAQVIAYIKAHFQYPITDGAVCDFEESKTAKVRLLTLLKYCRKAIGLTFAQKKESAC